LKSLKDEKPGGQEFDALQCITSSLTIRLGVGTRRKSSKNGTKKTTRGFEKRDPI